MKNCNNLNILTRFSDLDSQRHVNNASYFSYLKEGQFHYLENLGYDMAYLEANNIYLKPDVVHINFVKQQKSQNILEVETTACRFSNSVHWEHKIVEINSRSVSVHATMLCPLDKNYFPKIFECVDVFPEPLIQWDIVEKFSNSCKRSVMQYKVRHIDLDGFNQCSDQVLWRLNEESRWNFLREAKMSLEYLQENDTSLFWINGVYHYYSDVKLNDTLQIYTWISRCDNVRMYIRQEIFKNETEHVLRCEGEFISVSLARSRPKRIPDFLKNAIHPYMEHTQ